MDSDDFFNPAMVVLRIIDPEKAKELAELRAYRLLSMPCPVTHVNHGPMPEAVPVKKSGSIEP